MQPQQEGLWPGKRKTPLKGVCRDPHSLARGRGCSQYEAGRPVHEGAVPFQRLLRTEDMAAPVPSCLGRSRRRDEWVEARRKCPVPGSRTDCLTGALVLGTR